LYSKYAINGWLSTLEGNAELEICLFKKETVSNFLDFVHVHKKKEKVFYKNSLRKIKISPPQAFYDRSRANLLRSGQVGSDENSFWMQYKRFRRACITEGAPSDEEIRWRREEYFDLRAKLKI
jgi:hypothetical protein